MLDELFNERRGFGVYLLLAAGLLAGLGGCENNPLKIVPVSGVITFDGGPCPRDGAIYFAPLEVVDGLPKRTGFGKFDTNGEFTVTSFRPGDGLIPGKYVIWIECLISPISPGRPQGVSYISDEYEWPELIIELGTRSPVIVIYDVPAKQKQ